MPFWGLSFIVVICDGGGGDGVFSWLHQGQHSLQTCVWLLHVPTVQLCIAVSISRQTLGTPLGLWLYLVAYMIYIYIYIDCLYTALVVLLLGTSQSVFSGILILAAVNIWQKQAV